MNDDIHVRQLRYFVVLSEELHFGRAARQLRITQPALSQQLRALERMLGCTLLERRPRLALTPAGRTLLVEARQTLASLERGLSRTRQTAQGNSGTLSIGYASSAVLTHFPEIIRRYRDRFPEVSLHLRELSPTDELEAVQLGLVDVAFVREVNASAELVYDVVVREPFGVLLPANHKLRGRSRLAPQKLAAERFIHFPRYVAPALYDQVLLLCQSAGFVPQIVQWVSEWLTEVSLVRAGLGVAIVPVSLERLSVEGVHFRPLQSDAARAIISLCHRREDVSAPGAAFVRLARAVTKSTPARRARTLQTI